MSTIPTPEVSLETQPLPRRKSLSRLIRFSLLWKLALAAALVATVAVYMTREGVLPVSGTVAAAKRGPLDITVLEKGNIEALESQLIKSEVRGQTKVLDIVDEGYQVTPDDVKNKKVLVRLDDSEVQEDLTEQKIRTASAMSAYTDALTQYEVQKKQNESDITTSELAVKFAAIDFQKYLGADLAPEILKKFGEEPEPEIEVESLAVESVAVEEGKAAEAPKPDAPEPENGAPKPEGKPGEAAPAEAEPAPPAPPVMDSSDLKQLQAQTDAAVAAARKQLAAVDFTKLVDAPNLGGDAKQKKQELEAAIKLAEEELTTNKTRLTGSERLFKDKFITQMELDADTMKVSRSQIQLESAQRNLELFLKYELPKMSEKYLSDWAEARRKLSRVKREAFSKLAQAQSRLDAAEAQKILQDSRLKERLDRIAKCTIVAERPGIVIYAGSNEPWSRQGPIEKGSTINQQQEILSIPDLTQMGVNVQIHESSINKIKKGQKAKVRIVSVPDENLTGEVVRISSVPDTQQRWMNPDLKKYSVKIALDGQHEWLQRQLGTTAQVEIMITSLADALYVPIQAVSENLGERVCYVEGGPGLAAERRVVKTGEFNDKYIEIKDGLKEGERVLLRAPEGTGEAGKSGEEKPGADGEKAKPGENKAQPGQPGENGAKPERRRQRPDKAEPAPEEQPAAAPQAKPVVAQPAAAPAAKGDAPRGS
jgi:multidrug resistance efflux pump